MIFGSVPEGRIAIQPFSSSVYFNTSDGGVVSFSTFPSRSVRTDREGNVEKLTTPPSDVLKYTLEENGWIAIRPSGTEPKIKFYIGVKGNSSEDAAEKVAAYEDFRRAFLSAHCHRNRFFCVVAICFKNRLQAVIQCFALFFIVSCYSLL